MHRLNKDVILVISLILVFAVIPILGYGPLLGKEMKAALSGDLTAPALYLDMSLFEQISAVVGGFVFKPVHMLLTFVLIGTLWRLKSRDLAALCWGLFYFLLGETLCAVNYLVFNHKSAAAEFLHSYGMVVGFGFTFYALFEGLDNRMLHFSALAQKCALSSLCSSCAKSLPVACGARRLMLLVIASLLVVSALPLAAPFHNVRYSTTILGTPYTYSWPVIDQIFEARYAPLAAVILFFLAIVTILLDRSRFIPFNARLLAAAGLGAVSFSLLRFTLKTLYWENLIWADFWEELTELLFVLAVTGVLWLFRDRLIISTKAMSKD